MFVLGALVELSLLFQVGVIYLGNTKFEDFSHPPI